MKAVLDIIQRVRDSVGEFAGLHAHEERETVGPYLDAVVDEVSALPSQVIWLYHKDNPRMIYTLVWLSDEQAYTVEMFQAQWGELPASESKLIRPATLEQQLKDGTWVKTRELT